MLLANWREVLTRAWSMWLLYLSIFLGAVEMALPFLHGVLPVQPGTFVAIVFVTNILAAVFRLLAQRNL
jgi:hypothetical protein